MEKKPRKPRVEVSEQEAQQYRELAKEGKSRCEIARIFGRKHTVVKRHLERAPKEKPALDAPVAPPYRPEPLHQRPTLQWNPAPPVRPGAMDYLNIKSKGV